MSIVRQQSLFDVLELYSLKTIHCLNPIFSAINLEPIWYLFTKNKCRCTKRTKLFEELGTEATRNRIIETTKKHGYIKVNKNIAKETLNEDRT